MDDNVTCTFLAEYAMTQDEIEHIFYGAFGPVGELPGPCREIQVDPVELPKENEPMVEPTPGEKEAEPVLEPEPV